MAEPAYGIHRENDPPETGFQLPVSDRRQSANRRAGVATKVELIGGNRERRGAGFESAQEIESGTRHALLFMLEDLEENRRLIEEAHREWVHSVDMLRDPVMLHDTECRILLCNRAYAERAGLAFPDIIGRPYWECFPKQEGPLQGCLAEVRKMDSGVSEKMPGREFTLASGETFVSRVSCMIDRYGRGVKELHVFEDITDRKRAKEILEQSERHYRKLIEGGSDVYFVIDRAGLLRYRSPSGKQLTGWDDEEVLGTEITNYVLPEYLTTARHTIAEAISHHENNARLELRIKRKDGSSVDVEAVGRNLLGDPDVGGIVITVRDITLRKVAERVLIKTNRALKALSSGNEALVHATDESQLLREMCRIIVEVGGYTMAWVGFAEYDAEKSVSVAAQFGNQGNYRHFADIRWDDTERGQGPVGTAIREATHQVVSNTMSDPRFALWRTEAIKHGYASVLAFPLMSNAQAFGALCIYAAQRDAFNEEEIQLLGELANDLAFGIVNLRRRAVHEQSEQRLRRSMESTVQTLAATVEMRDPYTAGHQNRVAELATAIACEMRLPEDQVHGLHLASIVHDVGKIQIPSEILSKPVRLTDVEYEIIKVHATVGYQILKDVDFPWPIAEIVWQHHERLDGSGYPRGLKADDMLIEAKILAVADTLEAMSAARPYRPAVGIEAGLKVILSGRGTLYDIAATDACLRLFSEERFSFKANNGDARI